VRRAAGLDDLRRPPKLSASPATRFRNVNEKRGISPAVRLSKVFGGTVNGPACPTGPVRLCASPPRLHQDQAAGIRVTEAALPPHGMLLAGVVRNSGPSRSPAMPAAAMWASGYSSKLWWQGSSCSLPPFSCSRTQPRPPLNKVVAHLHFDHRIDAREGIPSGRSARDRASQPGRVPRPLRRPPPTWFSRPRCCRATRGLDRR